MNISNGISLKGNNLHTFAPDENTFNHISPVNIILNCNALQRWISNGQLRYRNPLP